MSWILALFWVFVQCSGPGSAAEPEFIVTAPERFRSAAIEIRAMATNGAFDEALELTGVEGFGDPIRVVLLEESSPPVRELPAWVSGYARADRRLVAVIPERVPTYPDRTMIGLMVHEVTHLLVADATGGRPVPRWFNEGVATVAAREWGLEDHARYAAVAAGRRMVTTRELDRGFRGGGAEARRAYAVSAAFVRWLRTEVDPDVTGGILRNMGRGAPFEQAFFNATGMNLASAETRFLRNRWLWATWLPFLTSPGALWLGITLLALAAIVRRTLKSREMRHRWEEEEMGQALSDVRVDSPPRMDNGEIIN